MMRTWKGWIGALALYCLMAPPVGFGQGISEPTPEQEQEIQEAMERGEGYQDRLEECRKKEQEARDAGNEELADAWRKAAEGWEDAIEANRSLIITLVDSFYQIQAPPGTTITYDPDSTDYGYTTGDKDAKEVSLCPSAFDDGADLVASVKLHELRHAWQIHWCWSSHDGYWGNCTFWDHLAEWDAYNEEEKAYDKGITKGMPKEEKDLIRQRIREHLRAIFRRLFGGFVFDLVRPHAGELFQLPVAIENLSTQSVTVQLFVQDEKGWEIQPRSVAPFNLGPEEGRFVEFMVQTPLTADPGTTDAVHLFAQSSEGTSLTDTAYIVVQPTFTLAPVVPMVQGDRGTSAPVLFQLTNGSGNPATATVQIANALDWPQTESFFDIWVEPFETKQVGTSVSIPQSTPPWAVNIVRARASVQGNPADSDRAKVGVKVNEHDVGPLALTNPPLSRPGVRLPAVQRTLTAGMPTTPTLWVKNTGHYDSFFDVFFEIELPQRSPVSGDAVLTSDSVHVSDLAPGESREVQFKTLIVDQPGTYTLRAYTNQAGDADATNDALTGVLTVTAPTRTRIWQGYR